MQSESPAAPTPVNSSNGASNVSSNGAADNETETVEQIQPNQTIYISNLNERLRKEELKKSLYAMFSQFGTVLDVVAQKTLTTRGQAFVAFKDIPSATNAMRAMQNFPFYDKPMRIQYAKRQSDIIAKLNGTFVVDKKRSEKREANRAEALARKKVKTENGAPKKTEKKKEEVRESGSQQPSLNPKVQPPNKILFVENLPDQCTDLMLSMLFQMYEGYKEVRMVAGKAGIAFVEFETEAQAGAAMVGLQHFKITPTNLMVISYSKK